MAAANQTTRTTRGGGSPPIDPSNRHPAPSAVRRPRNTGGASSRERVTAVLLSRIVAPSAETATTAPPSQRTASGNGICDRTLTRSPAAATSLSNHPGTSR